MNIKRKLFRTLILAFGLISLAMAVIPAKAQPFGPIGYNFLTNTIQIAGGTATNINAYVPMYRGRGVALLSDFVGISNTAYNVSCTFRPGFTPYSGSTSTGTTNNVTTPTFTFVATQNSSTEVKAWTNVPATYMDNFAWLQLTTISNQDTNIIYVTNVTAYIFP